MKYKKLELDCEYLRYPHVGGSSSIYIRSEDTCDIIYEMEIFYYYIPESFEEQVDRIILRIHKDFRVTEVYLLSDVTHDKKIAKNFFYNYLGHYPALTTEQEMELAWL